MILYFSGTGNSQWVARRLAAELGDDVVSINRAIKERRSSVLCSERPFVFVAPTYAWRMPRVIDQWIRDARFEGSRNAYFVLTCAGSCGNAAAYARKLCASAGLRFFGLAPVVMPENYLALYDTPDAEECCAIVERAEPRVAELAERVGKGEPFPDQPIVLKDRLLSGPVNAVFYPALVHDAKFSASDACVACGTCVERCSFGNITLVDGKPAWNGVCTHCMACIAGCPTAAVEYGPKSRDRHRHDLWTEELA